MKITEKIHALKHTFFIPVNQELKLERTPIAQDIHPGRTMGWDIHPNGR